MASKLALLGGTPVRTEPFPAPNSIGTEEKQAVAEVMETGVLSAFQANYNVDFRGGDQVRSFEEEWAEAFGVRHAIAVNSCTSGLSAALGAAGVGPGDEVIAPPFTMVASATAILVNNAVPVFADIDPATFCISPTSIRERITPRTRAIVAVDLWGQAADFDALMDIAREHGLTVVEDAAQAPFAKRNGRAAGALGHVGVYSFNYHKHIHTGEGGMVVTDDDELAERARLIRNHAEVTVAGRPGVGDRDLVNMIGFNFRMGELEAAIGRCQLRKGPELIAQRVENVRRMEERIGSLDGFAMPRIDAGNTHVYYIHGILYDEEKVGAPRDAFVQALKAELPPTRLRESDGTLADAGYTRPIYRLPLFQRQVGWGDKGCPFQCPHYGAEVGYEGPLCPITEDVERNVLIHEFMLPPMTRRDVDDAADGFLKVYENRDALRDYWSKANA